MLFNNLEVGYNSLIMEWNAKINLVSRKKENVFDMIAESREFLKYIEPGKNKRLMDLGTGGGFPGIVIKIHRPDLKITLLDSIEKKTKALKDIVERLELKEIEVICSRAEELGKQKNYKNKFDYITARSVTKLQLLALWSKNLIKSGGKLITIKGNDADGEILETGKKQFIRSVKTVPFGEKMFVIVTFK